VADEVDELLLHQARVQGVRGTDRLNELEALVHLRGQAAPLYLERVLGFGFGVWGSGFSV